MKISYNWLKQYIDINLSADKVAEILTDTGLEVEGIEQFESVKGGLEGIVVGEVTSCKKHPNADKLSVTTVNIGNNKELPIVCGAPNVAFGQKVVVATTGTKLYDGDNEIKIKKAKMRGEVSEGMICAEDELGLGTSHDGIMVLPDTVEIGTPANKYFEIETDTIFEIGLTPNRIDGASHIGTARDLVAFLKQAEKNTQLIIPSIKDFKIDNNNFPISIEIDDYSQCPRYSGITVSNVNVEQSPKWLQNRLKAIGLKPINNLVDISNFVLHETGQPLHFFDADKIEGNKVIIKTLKENTEFITLDEETTKLSSDDLMICNEKKAMCIAGVFGGLDSGVTENTKNIFIESAYFNPIYIRKTSKRHGLNTDASFRFERGTDANNTIYALKRAALLLKEIAKGEISSEIIDVYPNKIEDYDVNVSYKNIARLIGKSIEKETIKNILESLDIRIISDDTETLILKIPTYRVDVRREADVIEEILRIYGYNNIEISKKVNSSISYSQHPNKEKIVNTISNQLSNNGFNEIMCNSLSKADYYSENKTFKKENLVEIYNPLSKDLNIMRQTLLFGGLESIAYNRNHKNKNLKFYEFGNCYFKKDIQNDNPLKKYKNEYKLSLLVTGQYEEENWNITNKPTTFFHLKTQVENILKRLGFIMNNINTETVASDIFSDGLRYSYKNKNIIDFGIINKKILNSFDIDEDVFYAEFNWDNVIKLSAENKVQYTEISKYPEVKRDLALLLDKNIQFSDIKNLALKTEKKLLKRVGLFDIYEGKNIDANKKSYALSFILQDENKTLKDKQINKIMDKFILIFKKEFDAQLR
ncbi:MAG: phenylalanine--tRNA ligase subunit beta [Bacteroidales bacterium]|jgi:phenylalanyl-tRNA synthetase beta chain|nr:phenylalanine--tRNA ligase subunit beta [Bacteroidales bacterium]